MVKKSANFWRSKQQWVNHGTAPALTTYFSRERTNPSVLSFASFQSLWGTHGAPNAEKSSLGQDRSSDQEYGKWENVLETKILDLTYYADVAGASQVTCTTSRPPS
jgi:hypothetical protein